MVLLDISMPGVNGLEAIPRIRALHDAPAILMLSMHDEAQMAARALKAGGVDFALVETMSALEEAQAAVEGAREAGLPIAVTMTFDTNFHTMMGVKPAQAVAAIGGWGVSVIGANCGNGPAEIERIMTEMSQAGPEGVVLMAKSNAGMPRWKDDRITYGGTPEVMADYARRMRELGVRIIGGCCGSTPEHVAAMRAALDQGTR